MNRGVKIKRDVKLYLTKSYKMAVFLCHSMFNPLATFTANQFIIPAFDTLIMRYGVVRGFFIYQGKPLLIVSKRKFVEKFHFLYTKTEFQLSL